MQGGSMLRRVAANTLHKEIVDGGATCPSYMACTDEATGLTLEVFVKCSSIGCPPSSLAREVVGCLLAGAVGLSVAEPVLVSIDSRVVAHVVDKETALRFRDSVIPAFGSINIGAGYTECLNGDMLPISVRAQAVEAWAFDHLILNPDRTARKPNCMTNGEMLTLIDHEKSLHVADMGFLTPPKPWEVGWLPGGTHLFHKLAHSKQFSLRRLKSAWSDVDDSKIEAMLNAVPTSWGVASTIADLGKYLRDLHINAEFAFDNLERIVS